MLECQDFGTRVFVGLDVLPPFVDFGGVDFAFGAPDLFDSPKVPVRDGVDTGCSQACIEDGGLHVWGIGAGREFDDQFEQAYQDRMDKEVELFWIGTFMLGLVGVLRGKVVSVQVGSLEQPVEVDRQLLLTRERIRRSARV